MGTVRNSNGFTIIEVLITLAISSALVTVAISMIANKQNQASFSTGVNEFNTRIQSIIGDVRNGQFPENSNVRCSVAVDNTLDLTSTGDEAGQGEHIGCVFLGKVLWFDLQSSAVATAFSNITVAGKAFDTAGIPITTYKDSMPRAVNAGGVECTNASSVNLTETIGLTNGIVVTKIISSAIPTNPSAFGIFNGLSVAQDISNTSGNTSVKLVTIPGSSTEHDLNCTYVDIAAISTTAPSENPTIAICLAHGVGGKEAVVIIGSKKGAMYTELVVSNYATALSTAISGATC